MRNKENKLKRLADIVNSNDCESQSSSQQNSHLRLPRPKTIDSQNGISLYATPSRAHQHRVCFFVQTFFFKHIFKQCSFQHTI